MEKPELLAVDEQNGLQEPVEAIILIPEENAVETNSAEMNMETAENLCAAPEEENKQIRVNPPVPPGGRSRMGRRRRHRREGTER